MLHVPTGCDANPFGVDNAKKTIPDAQMSAHYTFSDHFASNGRLQSRDGWIGESTASWLQVGFSDMFSLIYLKFAFLASFLVCFGPWVREFKLNSGNPHYEI